MRSKVTSAFLRQTEGFTTSLCDLQIAQPSRAVARDLYIAPMPRGSAKRQTLLDQCLGQKTMAARVRKNGAGQLTSRRKIDASRRHQKLSNVHRLWSMQTGRQQRRPQGGITRQTLGLLSGSQRHAKHGNIIKNRRRGMRHSDANIPKNQNGSLSSEGRLVPPLAARRRASGSKSDRRPLIGCTFGTRWPRDADLVLRPSTETLRM